MIAYIKGTVAHVGADVCVLECGGIGYAVGVSARTASALTPGREAVLFTSMQVKEDGVSLVGFLAREELAMFALLTGVSGVGPKAALSILSSATPESFAIAVINEDETALTIAPGIGKKLALRIILELKDKVSKQAVSALPSLPRGGGGGPRGESPGSKLRDATAALAVLGYSQGEISSAMRGIDTETLTVEEIIREVLKNSIK